MGCPARATLIYGVETQLCEDTFFEKLEKKEIDRPYGVDLHYTNSQYNDEDNTNMIGVRIASVDNCTSRDSVAKMQTAKQEKDLLKFLKTMGIRKKPKLYITCDLD